MWSNFIDMKRLIDQEQKSIKEIWDKTQYIPIYQREFVWEDEHIQNAVKTIFDDMESEVESYMGNILIVNHEQNGVKGSEIVDGQQRTTFAFLLIKSIHELLTELKSKIPESEGNNDFIDLLSEEIEKAKNLLVIKREERYNEDHMARIRYASEKLNGLLMSTLEGIATGQKKNRKFRIVKMQEKIKNLIYSTIIDKDNPSMKTYKISGEIHEIKDIAKKVKALLKYFTENVKYIEIKLTEEKYATEIFERMNSTSKPLTDYELFKNYIAGQLISAEVTDVENKITSIDNIVNDENYKLDANSVIRSLLYLKQGRITTSKYKFNKLKEIYSKQNAPLAMYKEVLKLVENYSSLEKLQLNNKEEESYLPYMIIKTYNLKQLRPAMISMTMKYGHTKEVSDLFMLLVSIIFKKVVFNGEVANIIESLLYRTFGDGESLRKPQEIIKLIKEEKIYKESLTDEIDLRKFGTISKNEFIRILWIYSINKVNGNVNVLINNANSEISINFDKIQIEHILPRSWEDNWTDVVGSMDSMDRAELIDNPGNKMPILGKYNAQASNKSFEDKKKEHYVMSSLNSINKDDVESNDKWVITKLNSLAIDYIENSKVWTKKEIDERSKLLMDSFVEEINRYLN